MSKENNIKEKFKIALISTENAISGDYLKKKIKKKINSKEQNHFEIDTLNSKEEFVKYSNLVLKDNKVYLSLKKNLSNKRNSRNYKHVKNDLIRILSNND